MKKPPTRKGKAFEIPRPENSRPLIAAAILTIIALACGALALAGRIRPAEERQTPAYVPPTRPPISIDAPEGWRVFSYPEVLLDLQVIGPYGGLHDLEGIRIRFIGSDIFRPGCPSTSGTQGNGGCDAAYYRNRWLSLYSTDDRVIDSASAGERIIGGLPAAGISYVRTAESPDDIYSCELWYVLQNQGVWHITICSAPNEPIPPELLDALDTITWTTPAPTTAPATPTAAPS